jgi:hypothetical protein
MNKRMGRVPAVLIVSGMSIGLVASGMSAAAAADPKPRSLANECKRLAESGYVTTDTEFLNNRGTKTCEVKRNGMWQITKKKGNKKVKVKTSFKKLRGDVRSYVTYRFISANGKKIVTKKVRIKSGKQANVKVKLPKKGVWTVTATYKGRVISNGFAQ